MNMTKCKTGDKLLLRNGDIATMIKHSVTTTGYPCILEINGALSSVTKGGLQFVGTIHPKDVIGFSPVEPVDQDLIDKVLETIKADVINGDVTAIEELLKQVPIEVLKSYLPEE
jgi:hypothetical protein